MSNNKPYRHLFFLYAWAEPQGGGERGTLWRYRLEDPSTHEQHLFSRLGELVEFLQSAQGETQTGSHAPSRGAEQ